MINIFELKFIYRQKELVIMKIERFKESLKGNYSATDKILKITFKGTLEIPFSEIEETDYINFLRHDKKGDLDNSSINYGIEEYLYNSGLSSNYFEFELYDGLGNLISDMKKFDEYVKNIEKYNI